MSWREGNRHIDIVALREIRERGRSRTFLLSTVLAGLGIMAIVLLPTWLANGPTTYHLGLSGVPAGTSQVLLAQAKAGGMSLSTTSYPSLGSGEQALRDHAVDALLVDGSTLVWRQRPDAALASLVAGGVRAQQVAERAADLGIAQQDVTALLAPVALTDRRLGSTSGLGENAEAVGMISVILIFLAVTLYGNAVLTGVVQEKSNRVAEVLLSRVRPRELLAGKLLGIGALGLAQFAVVAVSAGVTLHLASGADVPRVPAGTLAWLMVWFVLGYAFYSVVYAGMGALVSHVEDAGSVTAPISVVLVAAYLSAIAAVQSPESTWTTVLSFIPPVAPFVMPLRLTLVAVPAWQLAGSAILTAASVWGLVLVAGRVYAGAFLRTGSRVRLLAAWHAGRPT